MRSVTPFASCLSDPQLQSIGQVAVESAWLERLTEFYIQRLARLNRKSAEALLDGRMMSTKLELLKMFGRARLKDVTTRNEFSDLIGKAIEANRDRNTVIHGLWAKEGKTKNALRNLVGMAEATKRTSPGNFKTMSATEINRVARDITAAFWLISLFGEKHWPTPKQRRNEALLREWLSHDRTRPIHQGNQPRP